MKEIGKTLIFLLLSKINKNKVENTVYLIKKEIYNKNKSSNIHIIYIQNNQQNMKCYLS